MAISTGGPAWSTAYTAGAIQHVGACAPILATMAGEPAASHRRLKEVRDSDLPPICDQLDVRLYPVRSPKRWMFSPALREALMRESSNADVVHVHSLNLFPQFAGWKAAKRFNIPLVLSPRGALSPHLSKRNRHLKSLNGWLWQNQMLTDSTLFHGTSEIESSHIAGRVPTASIRIVPNPMNLDPFLKAQDRFESLRNIDGPIVMSHGRIASTKGLVTLVLAMRFVGELFPNVHLVLIGPDNDGYAPVLRKAAFEAGIGDRFVIHDALNESDLASALNSATIWASPSLGENFGRSVADAMAAGLPVVTSPHVGLAPDAARSNALLVSENDVRAIAATIIELLSNPERRLALGARAREYVRRFDWRELGSQYIAMYNEAIALYGRSEPNRSRFW